MRAAMLASPLTSLASRSAKGDHDRELAKAWAQGQGDEQEAYECQQCLLEAEEARMLAAHAWAGAAPTSRAEEADMLRRGSLRCMCLVVGLIALSDDI